MQPSVQIKLLGLPQLSSEKASKQALRLNNPTLLLLYLANKADWVSRSELAFLFRPDDDESTALKHIRLLLHRAKKIPWASNLETDSKRAKFTPSTDVKAFKTALSNKDWQAATNLYENDFFADYSNADLATYSAWLELERADLLSSYQLALRKHAQNLEGQADFEAAAQMYANLLKLDDLNEDALQDYLKAAYNAGQREQALTAYKRFYDLLQDEYSALPLQETIELVERIQANKALSQESPSAHRTKALLPKQDTRFVGRNKDLARLSETLLNPDCRLLTLVGLGGSGKTRVALELARLEHSQFKDGVCFVPLAALSSSDAFLTSVAQALGLNLSPQLSEQEQLDAFLKDKELLLLLDNFEHLLSAGPALSDLLKKHAKLSCLVTSRERLKLKGEWLFDLEGLDYPRHLDDLTRQELEAFDALHLFINSAKRVAPRLVLSDSDLVLVAQIAQRVEGLPLALELAASWVKSMPIQQIVQQLNEGHDLLRSEELGLAKRHQNLNVILKQTWRSLSDEKKQTLTKFSIFQGGCSLEAAEAVTGAHFSILLSLVNESLLKRLANNRFDMHELLKQYSHAQLSKDASQAAQLKLRHSQFYYETLKHEDYSLTNLSKEKQAEFTQDLNNYKAAWQYFVEHANHEVLQDLSRPVFSYFFASGRLQEGWLLFKESTAQVKLKDSNVLAALKLSEGRFAHKLGKSKEAQQAYEYGLNLSHKHNSKTIASAYAYLGELHLEKGHYDQASSALEASHTHAQKQGDWRQMAYVNNLRGGAAKSQAQYELAKQAYTQSLEAFIELNDAMGQAIALNNLANVAEAQKEYETAKTQYLNCLALFEAMSFLKGIAVVKSNLSIAYLKLNKLDQAKQYAQESLSLKESLKDHRGIVVSQINLNHIFLARKDFETAECYAVKAFKEAQKNAYIPLIIESASSLVELCQHAKDDELAQELKSSLLQHPNCNEDTKTDLEQLKLEHKSKGKVSAALQETIHNLINLLTTN